MTLRGIPTTRRHLYFYLLLFLATAVLHGAWKSADTTPIAVREAAKVGQKVTWVVLGGHTISFNVPTYFPIFTIGKDGTVARNPKLDTPAGGSPKLPESSGNGDHNGPSKPLTIDAGTWNGQGFYSSGLISADSFGVYSLRFSTPGTYKFACLVHPLMVGTLEVTP